MIIGTAGHIDHGKTALVRSLTGVDADRLIEEKRRGLTIDLGFAYLPLASGEILGFVDVPGHEKFVHNMLAGATAVDFVLLVVAADDGVMPQTREHLAIVDLLEIRRGAVALTKIDVVDRRRRVEVEREVHELLEATTLCGAPLFPVSNVTGEGVADLQRFLSGAAAEHRTERAQGAFRLSVDRSFTRSGIGAIVTGAVLSGAVRVGDKVVVSPSGLPARVRSIHAQNRAAEEARGGERCALNLVGEKVTKEAVHRGDVVLAERLHAPTSRLDASVRLLGSEKKALAIWTPTRLHIGAAEVGARIVPLDVDGVAPGATALAQLVLDREIAACYGDRFILQDASARRTIGGGSVLDPHAPARKRRAADRLRSLACLKIEAPGAALAALLDCPPYFVDLKEFARDRALSSLECEEAAGSLQTLLLPSGENTLAMSVETAERLERVLLAAVDAHHENYPDELGIGSDRLRLALQPRLPSAAFKALLARLVERRCVTTQGAWVRRPDHEVKLSELDAARWEAIAPLLGGSDRFRPPRARDIAKHFGFAEGDVRRLLKTQSRRGALDEIAHDHFFLRTTTGEMSGILARLAESGADGEITAALFRDQLDNGRKVAIQILEFFDRHGVTLRRGDLRRVNKRRLELFHANAEGATTPGA